MNNPKVAIIILNWNGKKLLDICLPALAQQNYENFVTYLVDNGSTDGSIEYFNEKYSSQKNINLIKLDKNHGFAQGNNIAIQKALEDDNIKYIITLNNDAKPDPNFIQTLVSIAESDENIGSVAPKMLFYHEENLIDSVGVVTCLDGGGMNRGFKEQDTGQFDTQEQVFGPCAGAALYRVSALKKIDLDKNNYFDRDFFAYYEDLDLAWRLQLMGYKSIYTPKSLVYHVHSATGVSHSPFKAFYVQRNRLIALMHNFPFWLMLYSLFVLTTWRYLHLLNSALFKKKGPSHKLRQKTSMKTLIWITFKAWGSFILLLPRILKNRWKIQRTKKLSSAQVKQLIKQYSVDLDKMIYL